MPIDNLIKASIEIININEYQSSKNMSHLFHFIIKYGLNTVFQCIKNLKLS